MTKQTQSKPAAPASLGYLVRSSQLAKEFQQLFEQHTCQHSTWWIIETDSGSKPEYTPKSDASGIGRLERDLARTELLRRKTGRCNGCGACFDFYEHKERRLQRDTKDST